MPPLACVQAELSSSRLQVYWNGNKGRSFLLLADQTWAARLEEAASGAGRGRGRGWGGGGRARGRVRGAAAGPGPARGAPSWQSGPPPPHHRPLLASIAVVEFDRQAYQGGSIQRVRKTALHSYELYVVSDTLPPATLTEPGTEAAFLQGHDSEGGALSLGQAEAEAQDVAASASLPQLLTPTPVQTTEQDQQGMQQVLAALAAAPSSLPGPGERASAEHAGHAAVQSFEALVVQLAGELKLQAALEMLDQASWDKICLHCCYVAAAADDGVVTADICMSVWHAYPSSATLHAGGCERPAVRRSLGAPAEGSCHGAQRAQRTGSGGALAGSIARLWPSHPGQVRGTA